MEGKTGVDVQTPSGRKLHFIWLPEVSSTQDEMKALIKSEVRPESQQSKISTALLWKSLLMRPCPIFISRPWAALREPGVEC